MKHSRQRCYLLAPVVLAVTLSACSSGFVNVAPQAPARYQKLGAAQGEACGTTLLLIPIALNERIERAYAAALASVPRATSLIDVTMQERWFWWGLGTARCLTIKGEAVR